MCPVLGRGGRHRLDDRPITCRAGTSRHNARVVHLELEPGEAVLLHNWLLHASDVNKTDQSRRAFSVCYMDARTRNLAKPETFTRVFEPINT